MSGSGGLLVQLLSARRQARASFIARHRDDSDSDLDGGVPEPAETPHRDVWAELVQALLRWEESDEMSLSQDADLDVMAREVAGWDTNPASTKGEKQIPALIAELKASRKVIRAARKLVEQLSTLYIDDEPLVAALAELDSRSPDI